MFHPFFDPSTLSNQELYDKITDVSVRITAARSAGIQYELIQSMYTIIHACEEELKTRQSKNDLNEIKNAKNNCVFDTDSYLNGNDGNKNESTRKPIYKRGW